jgi:hypothetical protein
MIASLMMYARPELDPALGRYWQLIRRALAERGIDAPPALSNDAEEFAVWEAPDLVLSQTCGMPYRLRLHGSVSLIGTPDFGIEGCDPGYYRSAVVVGPRDWPRGGGGGGRAPPPHGWQITAPRGLRSIRPFRNRGMRRPMRWRRQKGSGLPTGYRPMAMYIRPARWPKGGRILPRLMR